MENVLNSDSDESYKMLNMIFKITAFYIFNERVVSHELYVKAAKNNKKKILNERQREWLVELVLRIKAEIIIQIFTLCNLKIQFK